MQTRQEFRLSHHNHKEHLLSDFFEDNIGGLIFSGIVFILMIITVITTK